MQIGGGRCSICGSPGTNKTSCPLNPNSLNPNPIKHPLAITASNASQQRQPVTAQAERQRVERARGERQRVERARGERQQAERQRVERARGERQQAERQRVERARGERQQAERQRVERARGERQQAERQQAEAARQAILEHTEHLRQRAERLRAARARGERLVRIYQQERQEVEADRRARQQVERQRRERQPGERQRRERLRQFLAASQYARQDARQLPEQQERRQAERQELEPLEAPSMQDTQWQQMQDEQGQQRPQEFDVRAAHTSTLINSFSNPVSDDIDSCTFMPATDPNSGMDFMIDTIREMDRICRDEITAIRSCRPAGDPLGQLPNIQGELITRFYDPIYNPETYTRTMHWTQGDRVTIMPLKYFASVVSSEFLMQPKVRIRLIGNPAIDIGGVSRSVYSKAGEYINSICAKEGDRHYFGTRMPKDSYDIIVGCIIAAIDKGFVLGVPLSYSILYCINNNAVPSISDIGLPTLMALMKMDNSEELRSLITTISTQQGVESAAPYHKYSETVLPKGEDGEAIDVTIGRRYEWLKRIIYHNLFGRQKKHLNKLIQSEKWLEAQEAGLNDIVSLMRTCRLEELAIVLGMVLTREAMTSLNIVAQYNPPSATTLQYIRDYINANEDKWGLFLRFVTGSTDPNVTIKVDNKARGLPSSSTCFNALHIRDYLDYDEFTREMDMSLTNSDNMGLA
jgi:colicin import membrane protein